MIYADSRYNGQKLVAVDDARRSQTVTVVRPLPAPASDYRTVTVSAGMRIDQIATRHMGDPGRWWQIADMNPEILDFHDIPPGTVLRIPSATFGDL